MNLEKALGLAQEIAVREGSYLLKRWTSPGPVTRLDERDVTTGVEAAVEKAIIDQLSRAFPSHGFDGEESGRHNPNAEYQWLIDPIDGTKYYVGRSSLFSVSIALLHRGTPVLGVVHCPTSGQCFQARIGGGAFLDGHRLSGPRAGTLRESIVSVDTPRSHQLSPRERIWFEARLAALSRTVYRVRALGQGALATCWVASGALDAYVDLTGYVKPQDTAAGRIIMQEAGLVQENLKIGIGPDRLLAAPRATFSELRRIIEEP